MRLHVEAADRAEVWREAQNVLCVRLDTLGDVLMTTPALRALAESSRFRRLTLLTSPAGAAAARLVPEIDRVLTYESPWMKASGPQAASLADHNMIRKLAAERFDAAVVFTVYSQSPLPAAMLCHLADIPLRLAHCRENPYQLLTDWVRETEPHEQLRHEVQRQLDLVAAIGATTQNQRLSLRACDDSRKRVREMLTELGLDTSRPWLVAHTGASASSRIYPGELFALALGTLAGEHGWQIVFTGSSFEAAQVEAIRRDMRQPSWSLAGKLSLGELAALVEAAPLLLANNTGPVHVAAAVGTPVVDLYALTNPQHTPWQVPCRVLSRDVPCKFCYRSICPERHHDCLRKIEPRQVVEAVLDLYAETTRRPACAATAYYD